MPRNFVLGFGLINPSRSSFNTFFSRTVEVPFTMVLAPVYNLSPAGKCLVLLQAVIKKQVAAKMMI
jgi:uncharacterized membrane protein